METNEMKIGDRIKVKIACRWGWVRGWRVITGFTEDSEPTIDCNGWRDFIVHHREILDHESR